MPESPGKPAPRVTWTYLQKMGNRATSRGQGEAGSRGLGSPVPVLEVLHGGLGLDALPRQENKAGGGGGASPLGSQLFLKEPVIALHLQRRRSIWLLGQEMNHYF